MTIEHKAFRCELKALDGEGTFEGYASVFGNVDSYGDIVVKGAFARTLDHWRQKAKPIPILWQHDDARPIGATLEASEDERGLRVKGRLLLGMAQAREAYEALKADVLGGLSIGFTTKKTGQDDVNGKKVRLIEEVRLWEYSLVTFPANEEAAVVAVKSMAEMEERIEQLEQELKALRSGGLATDVAADPHTHSAEAERLHVLLESMRDFTTRTRTRRN